jgi:hypothetical protein
MAGKTTVVRGGAENPRAVGEKPGEVEPKAGGESDNGDGSRRGEVAWKRADEGG